MLARNGRHPAPSDSTDGATDNAAADCGWRFPLDPTERIGPDPARATPRDSGGSPRHATFCNPICDSVSDLFSAGFGLLLAHLWLAAGLAVCGLLWWRWLCPSMCSGLWSCRLCRQPHWNGASRTGASYGNGGSGLFFLYVQPDGGWSNPGWTDGNGSDPGWPCSHLSGFRWPDPGRPSHCGNDPVARADTDAQYPLTLACGFLLSGTGTQVERFQLQQLDAGERRLTQPDVINRVDRRVATLQGSPRDLWR